MNVRRDNDENVIYELYKSYGIMVYVTRKI